MHQKMMRVTSETTLDGIALYFIELMNDSQIKNIEDNLDCYTLDYLNRQGFILQSIFPFRDDKGITYQVALFNLQD